MGIDGNSAPICPLPGDIPSDVLPMLVVAACFLVIGWAIRSRRRKRKIRRSGK